VQLLAGLMLNSGGIVLQLSNVLAEAAVLLLQLLHLDLQLVGFVALVSKGSEPIVPENHAVSHPYSEHASAEGRHLPA